MADILWIAIIPGILIVGFIVSLIWRSDSTMDEDDEWLLLYWLFWMNDDKKDSE